MPTPPAPTACPSGDGTAWITPSYRATDRFSCACLDEPITADDPAIVWDYSDEYIGPNGSLGPSACCPECKAQMEEEDDDDYGGSDYSDRMTERRQMGLCNF